MQDLFIVLPEILLGSLSLLVIFFSIIFRDRVYVSNIALLGIIIVCISMWVYHPFIVKGSAVLIKNFRVSFNIMVLKQVALLLTGLVLLSFIGYQNFFKHIVDDDSQSDVENVNRFSVEYVVTILLSCLGIFCVISAKDFITLFVSLELQAFCGYILTAINRKKLASEAAVKYFIIGSVASCFSLFGISILYGLTGSVNFGVINKAMSAASNNGMYLLAGIFIIMNLCFKLANAPFQAVVLDVYQGSPLYSLNFISGVQKIAAIAGLVTVSRLFRPIADLITVLESIAIISLFVGAIGGLRQVSLKRILGYSAVLNSGFILIAILNAERYEPDLIAYIIIYIANMTGIISLTMLVKVKEDLFVKDLSGVIKEHPYFGWTLFVFILSLMGLPPFGGFFIKFYVLKKALYNDYIWFCISAVIASGIAAYYYLNIIKVMIFDEDKKNSSYLVNTQNKEVTFAIGTVVLICIFIVIFPLYIYL